MVSAFVLALFVTLAGQGAGPVADLVGAPRRIFSHDVGSIYRVIGRHPNTASLREVDSMHSPVPNGHLRLDYGGLVITLLVRTSNARTLFHSMEITDTAWLETLKVDVPRERQSILGRLGQPRRDTATELIYHVEHGEVGDAIVTLTFSGDRLVGLRWAYPFD